LKWELTKKKLGKERKTPWSLYIPFSNIRSAKNQLAYTLGGEQQMLAIGKALISRPKLMMFDEPSLGLAPEIVYKVFEAIKEINRQGITILLVEQNVHISLKVVNRVYVLENGRII